MPVRFWLVVLFKNHQMNPDQLANIISFSFGVFVLFCFAHGYFSQSSSPVAIKKISDNIDIGYVKLQAVEQPVKQQVVVKYKEEKKPNLKTECVRILIAIGYSQEIAKQIVRDFFKKDTAKDLEEFFVKINKH